MKLVFIIAGLILIALAEIPSFSTTQRLVVPQPTPPLIENELLQPLAIREGDIIRKADGWQIPNISKLGIKYPRSKFRCAEFKSNRIIKCRYPTKVYQTDYEPDGLELPKMNSDGTADPLRKVTPEFDILVYDIDKRVFCYRMYTHDIPLKGEAGVAVLTNIAYYDLDGDGIFESWDLMDSPQKPLRMPRYIKP